MTEALSKLDRVQVPALDEILGVPFKVLDDGFVRVVDYMGTDESIVQAARVSYGKGTKKIKQDRELIRYLMRHRHTSPFEMCEIKLHVRVPMDAWRQWIRHRTANVNEYSTRYSVAIESAQKTPPEGWRLQSTSNRQGSAGHFPVETGAELTRQEAEIHALCDQIYKLRLEMGVAREQARKDLPLSTYTEAYWKIDLHNLLHFLELRMDVLAQEEIRSYAGTIGNEIVSRWCPLTWEAFQDYHLRGLVLSNMEIQILTACAAGQSEKAVALVKEFGLLLDSEQGMKFTLELREIEAKLQALGIAPPWGPPSRL
jgi:thymidylate synthase (FAD)